jgi:hypothetical protein
MLTVKERAQKDRIEMAIKFIVKYVNENTSTDSILSISDLFGNMANHGFNISDHQFDSLLRYLKCSRDIELVYESKHQDYAGIINPNVLHNRLCESFNIDQNIWTDVDLKY